MKKKLNKQVVDPRISRILCQATFSIRKILPIILTAYSSYKMQIFTVLIKLKLNDACIICLA